MAGQYTIKVANDTLAEVFAPASVKGCRVLDYWPGSDTWSYVRMVDENAPERVVGRLVHLSLRRNYDTGVVAVVSYEVIPDEPGCARS